MNFRIETDSIVEELRLKSITERTKVLNERKQSQPVLFSPPPSPAAASGSSSGGSGVIDNTVNNYVENGYVENYFE